MAVPIVKWAGGKTKLLPDLVKRMPAEYGRYYEPFAGGAALFFHVEPSDAVVADANTNLILMYEQVSNHPIQVNKLLEQHRKLHGSMRYYMTRELWNDSQVKWAPVTRAAAFIYLNKTCFNGLWRVNRRGEFNVPIGRYTDPPICVPDALRAASVLLRRATLRCCDYQKAIRDAKNGDFVYFDPPYDPVTETAMFTGYTSCEFGREQQRELATTAGMLWSLGCKVMLSNSDTPFVRRLYRGWRIERVKCGRSINSKTTKRGKVNELIITSDYKRKT